MKDGKADHITREPEQVKAFRDTWRDGIHSYLSYLRDRLEMARELLTESGSVFVQIGDENVHRVRALMDEVFGEENFVSEIYFAKTTGFSGSYLSPVTDTLLWYGKSTDALKYRGLWRTKKPGERGALKYKALQTFRQVTRFDSAPTRLGTLDQLTSQGASEQDEAVSLDGRLFPPKQGLHWKTTAKGLARLKAAWRVFLEGKSLRYLRFLDDFPVFPHHNIWDDIGGVQSRADPKVYVVQTSTEAVKRCILMTTDPGDLVLDPTCGSGTTAYVAEQWGRRWITIDTSRVALALARARVMGARYSYYLLADSPAGQKKEAQVTRTAPKTAATYERLRQGFVYKRVPHITLKAIANNAEIDVIWERLQPAVERALGDLNQALQHAANGTNVEFRAAGQPGSRAAGQPGSRAAGQPGSRAAGQPGSRAAGTAAGTRRPERPSGRRTGGSDWSAGWQQQPAQPRRPGAAECAWSLGGKRQRARGRFVHPSLHRVGRRPQGRGCGLRGAGRADGRTAVRRTGPSQRAAGMGGASRGPA